MLPFLVVSVLLNILSCGKNTSCYGRVNTKACLLFYPVSYSFFPVYLFLYFFRGTFGICAFLIIIRLRPLRAFILKKNIANDYGLFILVINR